jgi:DNA-binding transcriptional MerR regulator
MDKSPDAFRTISEVADHLDTPAHVLRFWESRFPQIRPVKRAGGRRYYRPNDVALLTGIKRLLHEEGMTIRGVQKILREQGVRHVAALSGVDHSADIELDAEAALEVALASFAPPPAVPLAPPEAETAQVVALETALRRGPAPEAQSEPADVLPLFAAMAGRVAPAPAPRIDSAKAAQLTDSAAAPEPDSLPSAALARPVDLRALLADLSAETLRDHGPALAALARRLAGLAERMATPPQPTAN